MIWVRKQYIYLFKFDKKKKLKYTTLGTDIVSRSFKPYKFTTQYYYFYGAGIMVKCFVNKLKLAGLPPYNNNNKI